MALVGSGTSKIKNFAAAASLSSADVDESLAAMVEQFGGVKWLNGSSARVAGNLTYDNFASSPAIGNDLKREARSVWSEQIESKVVAGVAIPHSLGCVVVDRECYLDTWSSFVWAGGTPTSTDLALYLNGLQIASITAWTTVSAAGRAGYAVKSVGMNLAPGSVISVSLTSGGATLADFSVNSALLMRGLHL